MSLVNIPDVIVEAIKNSWRDARMRWLLPAAAAAFVLVLSTNYGSNALTKGNALMALMASVIALVIWEASNRLPRVPTGSVGVVVAVLGEDKKEDQQVRADFIEQLRQLLEPDRHSTKFALLVLDQHIAAKCIDSATASQVLGRVRGHFLLYGTVRRRKIGGNEAHLLALEGLVRHAPTPPDVSSKILADFRQALPRRVHFGVDNDAFAFETTSEWVDVAARYVIGLAAMVSRDVWYAETLLLSAELRLKSTAPRIAPLRDIAMKLQGRFVELYSNWLGGLSRAYFLTRQVAFVEEAEKVATKLLARDPDNYQGRLQMAMSHFILRRDIAEAKREITACRRIRDSTWRYSRAFLLAYEGETKRAREEYNEAFQGRLQDVTVPVQVEEFIQLVLEEEPNKSQLHFFLGLINMKAKGDTEAALRDFRTFLKAPGSDQFPEERALAERYTKELEGEKSSNSA